MDMGTAMWTVLQLGRLAVGQATGDDPGRTDDVDPVAVQSVWDFVVKGGPVMIPIGLCSLVALTVFVERMASLRRGQVIPKGFFSGLSKHMENGDRDRDRALEYCQENASPVANVLAAGIKHIDAPIDRLEKHIAHAGEREVVKLRKYTRSLSIIASITPLLGLLGTIFGMIAAFQTVAVSGEALGKTELLARGIYQAMITTAAGLMVAIPVLIAFHWITAKVEGLVGEMDRLSVEFVETYAIAPVGSNSSSGRKALSLKAHTEVEDDEDEPVAAAASE